MADSMIVACGPATSPRGFDAANAQMRAYEWFRSDFLGRYPAGVVLTEYEYIGRTTYAAAGGTPVQYAGKPLINKLLSSMSDSFRRGVSFADFRKPDGMGLVELGRSVRVEILEVTTERNFECAAIQMRDKIGTLMRTVAGNMGHPFPIEVVGTPWRPGPRQLRCPATPDPANKEIARWICFQPTLRNKLPAGVTLYEVHSTRVDFSAVPAPRLSEAAEQALQRGFLRARTRPGSGTGFDISEQLPIFEPALRAELAGLVAILGMVAVVGLVAACAAAVADPVPGDEALVCGFALKVVERAARMAPAL